MKRAFMVLAVLSVPFAAMADEINLYAAGSLRAALGDVAANFAKASGHKVATTFAASGLLRQRIEKGEPAQVFASAKMKHPETLAKAGKAGPVRMFARNKLCAIAQANVAISPDTLLAVLLDPKIRLGTSIPKADPSGDYAWTLFEKAEKVKPGSFAALDAKAMKLTGGPTSEKAPKGQNQYGWVMASNKADVFLTYCTNAHLAQKQVPSLQIVTLPEALSVGANYGLTVLKGAPKSADAFAAYILSPDGQAILQGYGFDAP